MVGLPIPLAGFRIPKPWISDSTDQNYLDSGLPYTGRYRAMGSSLEGHRRREFTGTRAKKKKTNSSTVTPIRVPSNESQIRKKKRPA